MEITKKTFKEWDYPFIALDYEGIFNTHCPDAMLGGIVVFTEDNLNDVITAAEEFIRSDVPAIMVELTHIWDTILMEDVVTYLTSLFNANGYKDLESYEHRLAFGKEIG